MLLTHRSLDAHCATLWWRWIMFFVFPYKWAPVEWNWQGKTEVLGGKNLSQCHLVHHKSHMDWFWIELGLRGERPATNRLSRGTAVRRSVTKDVALKNEFFCCARDRHACYWKASHYPVRSKPSVLSKYQVPLSARRPAILTHIYHCSPQSLLAKAKILHKLGHGPFLPHAF
jgi:hypothetical protein